MTSWIVRFGLLVMFVLHGHRFSSAAELQGAASAPEEPLSLWYRRPARSGPRPCRLATAGWAPWFSAASRPNGCSSTKAHSGPQAPMIRPTPRPPAHSRKLRRLIFEGKLAEANRIVGRRMMAHPLGQMPYQTLGDLLLEFPPATSVKRLPPRPQSRHGDRDDELYSQ